LDLFLAGFKRGNSQYQLALDTNKFSKGIAVLRPKNGHSSPTDLKRQRLEVGQKKCRECTQHFLEEKEINPKISRVNPY
jgi:hypothetical protein